jgi:CheY-like chemotaxis protein
MLARETESPATALEWIRRGDPFDVALLDYQMPEMDGVTLATEIRALRGAQSPPLVLLSSVTRPFGRELADQFAAVLTKPLKLSHLRERLFEALGESAIDVAPSPINRGRHGNPARLAGGGQCDQSAGRSAFCSRDSATKRTSPTTVERFSSGSSRPLRCHPHGRPDAGDGRARGQSRRVRALAGR